MKRRNHSIFREESTSKERRLVPEVNFKNDDHSDTYRNEDDQVELILVDFRNDENQKRLRNKFSLQTKGKLLWLENKMVKNICTNFIPIEFGKDVEYICRYYNAIFEKLKSGFCKIHLEEISGDALRDPDVLITLARIDSIVTSVEAILENEREVFLRLLHKYAIDAMLKFPALFSTLNDLMFEFDKNNSFDPFLLKLFNDSVEELKNPKHIFKVLEEGASKYYPYTLFLKNRKVMLANACKYGLHSIHSHFFGDEEFILEVVQKNRDKYIMPVIRNFEPNAELMLKIIEISPNLFTYTPSSVRKDSSFFLKAIQINPQSICFALTSLICDIDFISSAIDVSVEILNFIELSPLVFDILEKKVKNNSNQDCALNIMTFHPALLKYIDSKLIDRDFIVNFLKKIEKLNQKKRTTLDLSILENYLTNEMRQDEELLLQFILINAKYLTFASENLQNNKSFLLKALKSNKKSSNFFPSELLDDKEFILELIKNGDVTYWLDEFVADGRDVYSDPEFILKVIANATDLLTFSFSETLSSNRDFAIRAVRLGANLRIFDETIRNDKEIQEEAAKYQGFCLQFSEELFNLRMEHKYFGCKI